MEQKTVKKAVSYILITGTLFVIIILFFYFNDNPQRDKKVVGNLESEVLPFVKSNNIQYYFDLDWCKAIGNDDRVVAENIGQINPSSGNCAKRLTLVQNVQPFSQQDQELFGLTKQVLNNSTREDFIQISPEYSSLPEHKYIGLAFHIECFWCRTRYVYWQNYDNLPPNEVGEIRYTPINSNWYRIDEDWN